MLGRTGFVVAVAYGSIILLYSDAVDSTQQGRILGMSIAVVNLPGPGLDRCRVSRCHWRVGADRIGRGLPEPELVGLPDAASTLSRRRHPPRPSQGALNEPLPLFRRGGFDARGRNDLLHGDGHRRAPIAVARNLRGIKEHGRSMAVLRVRSNRGIAPDLPLHGKSKTFGRE